MSLHIALLSSLLIGHNGLGNLNAAVSGYHIHVPKIDLNFFQLVLISTYPSYGILIW